MFSKYLILWDPGNFQLSAIMSFAKESRLRFRDFQVFEIAQFFPGPEMRTLPQGNDSVEKK